MCASRPVALLFVSLRLASTACEPRTTRHTTTGRLVKTRGKPAVVPRAPAFPRSRHATGRAKLLTPRQARNRLPDLLLLVRVEELREDAREERELARQRNPERWRQRLEQRLWAEHALEELQGRHATRRSRVSSV